MKVLSAEIRDDSSSLIFPIGCSNAAFGVGIVPVNGYWIDSVNINVRMAATYVNLDDNVDTVKYLVRITDLNR